MNISTWEPDWAQRIYQQLHDAGYSSVGDFLHKHPNVPFFKVARLVSPEVAAVQIATLAFQESERTGTLIDMAKDALCRILHRHLKKGWNQGFHVKRMMAAAYAEWLSVLEFRTGDLRLRPLGEMVWKSIEEMAPDAGWLPIGPEDPIVVKAFEVGWKGGE